MKRQALSIKPSEGIALSAIPDLSFQHFYDHCLELVNQNAQLVQFFAFESHSKLKIMAVFRLDGLYIMQSDLPETYESLTKQCEKFNLFERELAEQYGVLPEGHPWFKAVRYHANFNKRPELLGYDDHTIVPGPYAYFQMQGDGLHEVAVGPVHAGIIEPGHFRFQCLGEIVHHLEIQLGYQHRGIESMLTQVPNGRMPVVIDGIAGDTAVGNSLCFSQAIEGLTGQTVNDAGQRLRFVGLELERLANHVGDLGAMSGDVAFLPVAAYFGRLRGEFLNLLLRLSGNRFGMHWIRPGGVMRVCADSDIKFILAQIKILRPQLQDVGGLLLSRPSVLSRFETVGKLTLETVEKLGLVGPAARAAGNGYDVRAAYPNGFYQDQLYQPIVATTGDVFARAQIRLRESMASLDLIESLFVDLDTTEVNAIASGAPSLAASACVITLNEAWRGELSHMAITDETGRLIRYKIKDPSWHNWSGLSYAMRGQEISDFPLCNKSFNLSYCGVDL